MWEGASTPRVPVARPIASPRAEPDIAEPPRSSRLALFIRYLVAPSTRPSTASRHVAAGGKSRYPHASGVLVCNPEFLQSGILDHNRFPPNRGLVALAQPAMAQFRAAGGLRLSIPIAHSSKRHSGVLRISGPCPP